MNRMNSIGLVSLGCSKNRVDSETLLGYLGSAGFVFTQDAAAADILIVNTCGFITSAKEESINTILEMAAHKSEGSCKLLIVCGCLSQRYLQELHSELPEVDLFWGVKDQLGLAAEIARLAGKPMPPHDCARILTTPPYSAYLRIADGCDNRCTYCAIPLIRGGRVSVPMEKLVQEARSLAQRGVKELTVIAQDTSAYGMDIYEKPSLAPLLKQLNTVDGIEWIRVLYTYPDTVDEQLIDTMLSCSKVVNYIDMPIQHIDPVLLKSMNRRGSDAHIKHILDYIRAASSDFILRTTVIVGFPGESEQQFGRLTDFLREYPFDRLGAFTYSPEDGTPAAELPEQISEDVKQQRYDTVMRLQQGISLQANGLRINKAYTALIDEVNGEYAYARTYAEAPDVDGLLKIKLAGAAPHAGEFISARITGASQYDLWGEQI